MKMTSLMSRRYGLASAAFMFILPGLVLASVGGVSGIDGSPGVQAAVAGFMIFISWVASLFALLTVLRASTFIDASVVRRQGAFRRRSLPLSEVDSFGLENNTAGTVSLVLSRQGRTKLRFGLLMLTDFNRQALPPEELEHLASIIQAHPSGGASDVVTTLRSQAEHLRSGGDLAESPLGRCATHTSSNLAKAGAVGAGVGSLG